MSPAGRLPVTLLTGFLGSGKTTLLNRLVGAPEFADCVVIVNEFGEIGLDHLLIEHVDESMRILNNGCVCCTVRGDLIDTLADLAARRRRGELRFSRAVIETTGLADPAPIIHSLIVDPSLTGDWVLDGVVTTIDAINGPATLKAHKEAARQAGVADVLVITKTDLTADHAVASLRSSLRTINPQAEVVLASEPGVVSGRLTRGLRSTEWRPLVEFHAHEHSHDTSAVRAHCLVFDEPVEESAVLEWLDLLAAMRGEDLLRVKGIVAVAGDPARPRVIQSVQHVVHPVTILESWPSDDRRTRLVFITQDIDTSVIDRTFKWYAAGRN